MGRIEAIWSFLPIGACPHGLSENWWKDDKNANVLVITDHFTRYAQVIKQASTVVHVFIDKFVTNYGWPVKILTDQAKDFNGLLFSALCQEAKIMKMRMLPYHPQTNGQTKRFNHTLMTILEHFPQKKNWIGRIGYLTSHRHTIVWLQR